LSIQRVYREIFETLRNRSFVALFSAALMGAIGTGIAAGLFTYINSFFWGFSTIQVGQLNASIIISAIIALLISPIISRRLGKKRAAIIIGLLTFTILPVTIVLRLFGVMPENGDPQLFSLMLIITVVDVSLIISYQTITTSMIADLVKDSEVQTGRRSEGVFFASMTFIKKFVQGFGVLMATTILTMAQFPAGVAPGEVPSDALFRLGAYYMPAVVTVWMLMIVFISKYSVSRDTHNANLSKLGRNSADSR
ncbi:MAG: MFS transporter, partial [Porticoccaceae bacterium]|nr:MFS transporter [Porticoccaceae bacterium]